MSRVLGDKVVGLSNTGDFYLNNNTVKNNNKSTDAVSKKKNKNKDKNTIVLNENNSTKGHNNYKMESDSDNCSIDYIFFSSLTHKKILENHSKHVINNLLFSRQIYTSSGYAENSFGAHSMQHYLHGIILSSLIQSNSLLTSSKNSNYKLFLVKHDINFQIATKLNLILPDSVVNYYNFSSVYSDGLIIDYI